jgi:hypothetical protein
VNSEQAETRAHEQQSGCEQGCRASADPRQRYMSGLLALLQHPLGLRPRPACGGLGVELGGESTAVDDDVSTDEDLPVAVGVFLHRGRRYVALAKRPLSFRQEEGPIASTSTHALLRTLSSPPSGPCNNDIMHRSGSRRFPTKDPWANFRECVFQALA